MPELPEVETIVRDLRKCVLNLKIAQIEICDAKVWRGKISPQFLVGQKFCEISRRGKFLIFKIDENLFLIAHLRMTGQFFFVENLNLKIAEPKFENSKIKKNETLFLSFPRKRESRTIAEQKFKNENLLQIPGRVRDDKNKIWGKKNEIVAGGHGEKIYFSAVRAEILFENGAKLFFADTRKFGFLEIFSAAQLRKFSENWGVEPLEKKFTFAKFRELLRPEKNIKSFLLDQKIIAGIGNIYADEILFAAKVAPVQKCKNLNEKKLRAIFLNLKKVLRAGIENRGTTFNSFRDARGESGSFQKFLKVYGRGKKVCVRCGANLRKIRVAGRGTVFCEKCQK